MANYAIGDVQGCYQSLLALLDRIEFSEKYDTLWFAGDLVNRGPQSLETLRFLSQMPNQVRTVLGNHDLHLIARWAGHGRPNKSDTLDEVLDAPDAPALLDWLRQQPLVLELPKDQNSQRRIMVHAGISPSWSIDQALQYSQEFQHTLTQDNWAEALATIYGNQPALWSESLTGAERLRVIVNTCTRMRMLEKDQSMNFGFKLSPKRAPSSLRPWFEFERSAPTPYEVVFGHWSNLESIDVAGGYCLDTGCVWGNQLTALRLEDDELFQVEAVRTKP